jgi:hypothetical protein
MTEGERERKQVTDEKLQEERRKNEELAHK